MERVFKGILVSCWIKVKAFALRKTIVRNSASNDFVFIDICWHLLFLIATTYVTMSTRGTDMFLLSKTIARHFVERIFYNEHGSELTFNDLVTVADWWSYIETTFIKSLDEIGGQDDSENGNSGKNFVVLGEPRLRQIRVRNETCSINDAFRRQFRTCHGMYSKFNEDSSHFFNVTQHGHANINSIWGKVTTYYGPGLIINLSLDAESNKSILDQLKSLSWIDRATRVILIEFVSYNPSVNLLCSVKLLTEMMPSGGILTSASIHTLRYSLVCEEFHEYFYASVFYALILFQTFEYAVVWKKLGFSFVSHSLWMLLDIIVILVAYLSLFYVIWHTMSVKKVVESDVLEADLFDVICYWNMFFNTGMGICVFITWIKIFKFIQFNETMLRFNKTIKRCAEDVLSFCLMLAIVLVAYAELSVLLFGAMHVEFKDFLTSMITMTRMFLGDVQYSEMEESSPVLGPIYFLSYILFVFFILLNMFLAIIVDTYSAVAAEATVGNNYPSPGYLDKIIMKLKSYRKNSRKSNEIDKNPLPSELSKEDQEYEKNIQHDLHVWFDLMPKEKTMEEFDNLNQRITRLEKTIDGMAKSLGVVF